MDLNRVWAEINLDAVMHNLEAMHENLNDDTKIMAVVKTDAYGHGAVEIASMLEEIPYVFGYATATVDEAFELRSHHIKKPILVLGYTFRESYDEMVKKDIRPTIFTREMAEEFDEAARQNGKKAPIHIGIDTGMSRIGFQAERQALEDITDISKMKNLELEGIFTHFARADEADKSNARVQLELFLQVIHELEKKQVYFKIRHCANSASILELPEAKLDMVRAGITLYGLWPSDEMDHSFSLEPVLSLYSHVVHVKTLDAGRAISYGGTYVTDQKQVIATIPVGYGDGYARHLSNCGYVLIHGQKAPIVGRVCMDQFMVDVTGIENVKPRDKVVLVGKDGSLCITLEELGELSGRFNYEFACVLGRRIPRIFIRNEKRIALEQFFD